jgi:hypothetical protein
MGDQLWTSPITGYRRKGTRLKELRHLFEDGITARAVFEPLQACPADADAAHMAEILLQRDFDVAGVQERPNGPVIGFVLRELLQAGTVREHLQTLTAAHLISDATPLASLLSVLKTREHAFVLLGPEVRGIITRADLNKPPVRVYLFGLISLFEMHLTFWVKDSCPGDSWKKDLTATRIEAAEELLRKREARKENIDLLLCLQFCDKRDLVLQRDDLRGRLGLGSKRRALAILKHAEKLRDLLAHSQQDLTEGLSWPEIIEVVEMLENTVHKSDDLVEEKASRSAGRALTGLWASA